MESLNDLIWNPEDDGSVDTTGIGGDGDHMDDICMKGFCWDVADTMYACKGDNAYLSGACIDLGT